MDTVAGLCDWSVGKIYSFKSRLFGTAGKTRAAGAFSA